MYNIVDAIYQMVVRMNLYYLHCYSCVWAGVICVQLGRIEWWWAYFNNFVSSGPWLDDLIFWSVISGPAGRDRGGEPNCASCKDFWADGPRPCQWQFLSLFFLWIEIELVVIRKLMLSIDFQDDKLTMEEFREGSRNDPRIVQVVIWSWWWLQIVYQS